MDDGRAPPEKRFLVHCSDEEEFRRRFAPVFARRGVFVASESPDPVGTRVRLRLELKGPGRFVSGEAVVDRHAGGRRRGAYLKFLRFDPGSLELGESTDSRPVAAGIEARGSAASPAGPVAHGRPVYDPPWEAEKVEKADPVFALHLPPAAIHSEAPTSVETPRAQLRQRARANTPAGGVQTRVHVYREEELQLLRDPDRWAGGLRPFDVLDNFQLLTRLGSGGMAEVFLARSTLGQGVEKLVAFKLVLPDFGPDTRFASLFLNEARISATLQHANLIQVFGLGEAVARPYLAMEYVHGRTLGELVARLRERGVHPPRGFAVGVTIELCKALEYVHGKRDLDGRPLNLVHRDVSSGNVLVSEQGEVKLVDFGVASDSSRVDELGGVVVGTRGYMSPEQSRGETPAPSWDLFSLGVLLHQLLGLCRADGAPASRDRAGVTALLDRAVLWALDPEPARRAPSARALRELLEQVRGKLPDFSLAALMGEQFGEELALEQHRIEQLISEARRLAPPRRVTGNAPLLRPLRAVRRRLAATRLCRRLGRHRGLAAVLAAGLLAVCLGAGGLAWRGSKRESALVERLTRADALLRAARLVSPTGGGALEVLLRAKAEAPDDPRVVRRLGMLADALEGLGRGAEARGNLAEAAVHYQGALAADPLRAELAGRLARLEAEVRARSAGGRVP